jgi:hypothetical protein
VELATDSILRGTIQVSNLAFEKHVEVIYTLDDWNTNQVLDARYMEPIAHSANTWDRFVFDIHFNPCHQTMNLAVKYTVAGREFWDNNQNKNYQVEIIPDVQLFGLQDQEEDTSSDESDEVEEDLNLDQLSLNETPLLSPSTELTPTDEISPTTPADTMYYFQPKNQKSVIPFTHSYFYNSYPSIHT